MNAKEYLQQLRRLDTIINQKIKELNDLQAMSTSVGSIDYSKDRVQSNYSGDAPYVKTVNRMIDLNEEINREIDGFINKKHEIINQIQKLKNTNYVELLFRRYVEYKKFEDIAFELGFTYQYIVELHGYALKEFQTTYENLFLSGGNL